MPNIQISELTPAGFDLFQDSENFLNELRNDELLGVIGGATLASLINFKSNISIQSQIITAVSAVSNSINANTVGNINTQVG